MITSIALCANLSFSQNTWDGGAIETVTTNGNITATNGNLQITNGVLGIGDIYNNTKLNVNTTSNTITKGISSSVSNTNSSNQYGILSNASFTAQVQNMGSTTHCMRQRPLTLTDNTIWFKAAGMAIATVSIHR